jgi:hypothetical protein
LFSLRYLDLHPVCQAVRGLQSSHKQGARGVEVELITGSGHRHIKQQMGEEVALGAGNTAYMQHGVGLSHGVFKGSYRAPEQRVSASIRGTTRVVWYASRTRAVKAWRKGSM